MRFFGLLSCLIAFASQAQGLRFSASSANVDSFPLVRFNITVSENGSVPSPPLFASNFAVTEDGQAVNPQLIDCDDSRRVAVAICVDQSTSMISSAGDTWDVYMNFRGSFGELIGNLKPQSKYTLISYTDIQTVYPLAPRSFYQSQDPADYNEVMDIISSMTFYGNTDVDKALFKAASILEYSGLPTKAIVLVTDDYIKFPDSVSARLQALGIILCVFQAGSDFTKYSFDVVQATGGLYFQVSDSSQYDDVMREIAEHLSAEHCTLRYVSPNPCPWYRTHQVSLTLNRGNQSRNLLRSYTLGYNFNDKTPPPITEASPTYITRRITATGNFPCERGLSDFHDSLRQNIAIFSRSRAYPSQASDSLRVLDTLSNARAVYVAVDSGGNRSELEVIYTPQSDTLAPEIALTSSTGGNYRALITETRPWDRGLFDADVAPGALNLAFDSIRWYSRTTAQIWFHQPDPKSASMGCVEVRDSVGNVAQYCIDRSGPAGDTLPPVITQNPLSIPRITVSASIAELRPNDRGIKQIAASSLANFANQNIGWLTNRQASIAFDIIDSLQPARAYVSASDSLDNVAADTILYDPLPDNKPPTCTVETTDVSTRKFKASELAPWDRGIRSVTIVGAAINLTVSPLIFTNRFEAEQSFALTDRTLPGSVALRATDSAELECMTTISIEPSEQPPVPLLPLESASIIDFGTVFAPADTLQLLSVTNPNDKPVVVTQLALTGNAEILVTNGATPFIFTPYEQRTLGIRYQPNLLGAHTATLTLANDTMQLSQTTIQGQAIGTVWLHFDSVSVSRPNEAGVLHFSVEAVPDPINLDTIRFTIEYNPDVAVLSPQTPDCAGGNPLCDYTVTYSGNPLVGVIVVELVRQDRTRNQSLTAAIAKIDIPFETFLTKDSATTIVTSKLFASQSSEITSDSGMITVGSGACGSELLRAYLGKKAPFTLERIMPNPAQADATLVIHAAAPNEVVVALYDSKGNSVTIKNAQLQRGKNILLFETRALTEGHYTITLASQNAFVTGALIIQR